jgi:hypothetical protein
MLKNLLQRLAPGRRRAPADKNYTWNADPLPVNELHARVDSIFDGRLAALGFEHPRTLVWVRSGKPEIRDLFMLGKVFRSSLAPAWGFSCDFVPHLRGSKVVWHRTPKSARFDLFYDPWDYSRDTQSWQVSQFLNKEDVDSWAGALAQKSLSRAVEYWERVQSVGDLLSEFRVWQASKPIRFGFDNYPDSGLALAFVLKRLGEDEEASGLLEDFVESTRLNDACQQRLRQLLSEAEKK